MKTTDTKYEKPTSFRVKEKTFTLLYDAENIDEGVMSALKYVGEYAKADRAYIFENTADGRFASNIFEWCDEKTTPMIERFQNVDLKKYGTQKHFNEREILFINLAEETQSEPKRLFAERNVCSLLIAPITEYGNQRGFVGFDFCCEHADLDDEKKDTLRSAARIIGTGILKGRLQGANNEKLSVIENLNMSIFVVDKEYTIRFFNDEASKISPNMAIGKKCYEVCIGKGDKCENCPIEKLSREKIRANCEMVDRHGERRIVNASNIVWNGQDMYLVTGQDMTNIIKIHDSKLMSNLANESIGGGIICRFDDEDWPVYMINRSMYERLGYKSENEFIRMTCGHLKNCIHPDDWRSICLEMNKKLSKNQTADAEFRMIKKNGDILWISARDKKFVSDDNKNIVISVCQDITELVEQNEQLDHEKSVINNIISSISGGVGEYLLMPDSVKVLYCSPGVAAMRGKTMEDYIYLLNEKGRIGIYHLDKQRVMQEVWDCVEANRDIDISYRIFHSDHYPVWVNMKGKVVGKREGHPVLHMVFNNLSASEQLYQNLLDEAESIIQVSDSKTHEVLFINKRAAEFAGKEQKAFLGQKCYNYLLNRDTPCEACENLSLTDGKQCHMQREVNGRHFDIRAKKIKWNGRDAFVEYLNDITETWTARKQMEEANQKMQAVIENTPGGLIVMDCQRDSITVSAANPRIYAFCGESAETIIGSSILSYLNQVHPNDRESVRRMAEELRAGSTLRSLTYRHFNKQKKQYRWLSFSAKSVLKRDGTGTIYTCFIDVDELHRLQEKWASLIANIPGGVSINCFEDGEFKSVYNSDEVYKIFGYERKEKENLKWDDKYIRVHPDDRKMLFDKLRKAVGANEEVRCEYRALCACGVYQWVSYAAFPQIDLEGKLIYYGIYSNIDKEKRAEIKINHEHLLLANRFAEENQELALMAGAYISTMRVNLTKNIIESATNTDTCFAALSVNKGESYSAYLMRILELIPDKAEKTKHEKTFSRNELLSGYVLDNVNWTKETLFKIPGKGYCWMRYRVSLRRHPDSEDIIAFIYRTDATSEKDTSEILGLSIEGEYKYIAKIYADSGKYTLYSAEDKCLVEDMAEYSVGMKKIISSEHPEHTALWGRLELMNVLDAIEKQRSFQVTYDIMNANKSVSNMVIQFSFINRQQKTLLMTCRDITAVVKEERIVNQRLEDALRAAKKANDAKSEFLARMSHDMRTPLNAILGFSSLGMEEAGPEIFEEYFSKIHSSSTLLLGLVNDTLDMTKIENHVIKLNADAQIIRNLLPDVETLIKPLCAEKNINFSVSSDECGEETVLVDKIRFNQIIFNLLSNSVKFTPSGGKIELITRDIEVKNGKIVKRFVVQDNGRGMSKEFQKTMFEPFTQEDNDENKKNTGSGLGLCIVKSLVDMMGGTITVKSELGNGTEIIIDIPFEITSDIPDKRHEDIFEKYFFKGKRILVCEDHHINAEIIRRMLEKVGAESENAENGAEGVKKFASSPEGYYSGIFMDIRMPIMDGFEATRHIRALPREDAAEIPIIAMTANAFEEDREQSLKAGMNEHISKPIRPKLLYETMHMLLK